MCSTVYRIYTVRRVTIYSDRPDIRFNPDELHPNDPHIYNILYCRSRQKRNKDKHHAVMSGAVHLLNVILDHDHRRRRRSYIADLF
jgi:hypothetical protein